MSQAKSALSRAAIICGLVLSAGPVLSSRYWEEPPRHFRDAGRALDAAGGIRWHVDDGRIEWLCATRDIAGCAVPWPDGACDVWIIAEEFDNREARDHEGAHCVGWQH